MTGRETSKKSSHCSAAFFVRDAGLSLCPVVRVRDAAPDCSIEVKLLGKSPRFPPTLRLFGKQAASIVAASGSQRRPQPIYRVQVDQRANTSAALSLATALTPCAITCHRDSRLFSMAEAVPA